jgi:hypothetical protein
MKFTDTSRNEQKNINIKKNIIVFCKKRKENHFHADLQILLVIAKKIKRNHLWKNSSSHYI